MRGGFMRLTKRFFCMCLVMMLPIGYYSNENDSSSVWFRVGGGVGQYSTIVESCNEPPRKYSNSFYDAGAEIAIRPIVDAPVIFGLRGGHLSAGIETTEKYGSSLENGYLNPHFALETEYFGGGIGWVRNIGPTIEDNVYWDILGDIYDIDPVLDFRRQKNFVSGHVRLGSYSTVYAIGTLYEGVPAISQYGPLMLGLGFGVVPKWNFMTGISGGFYDQGGFYFGVSHDMAQYGSPALSFRAGSADGDFEGAFSLNWTFTIK